MRDNINHLSLMLVGLVMTAGVQAQDNFMIQGMKVGMTEAEVLAKAEELKDSRDIQRTQHIFKTPQGEELEQTIHTSAVFWVNLQNANEYRVQLTRKPMEPRAARILRRVSYEGIKDVTQRPTFEDYKEAIFDKYGEPINVRENMSHWQGGATYHFAESELPTGCPSILEYQYKTYSKIKDCPAILEVQVSYLNQPNYPLKFAVFKMRDPYLAAKDNVEFRPYWNQWMNDYLKSKENTADKPVL